jgi:small subunit ribosomal protein S6
MRHYEIMIMIHPDQSEQVPHMLNKYREMVEKKEGQVHRLENCGRLQLAYPIQKLHKAHYVVMNIECGQDVLDELNDSMRFNDSVLRKLVLVMKEPVTEPSPLIQRVEERRRSSL